MNQDVETILFDSNTIKARVLDLGKEIAKDYAGRPPPVLVCVLKGAFIFASDISRALDLRHTIEFMRVSSYENTESTGNVTIVSDISTDIGGKDIIIVEDIFDTGHTLSHLVKLFKERGAASVECCVLLSKPANCKIDNVSIKYLGFVVDPPQFVIGYGLDYNGIYRNLPYVGIPTSEAIERGKRTTCAKAQNTK
jgi:hypoxanthine phosphoribosyltransferase